MMIRSTRDSGEHSGVRRPPWVIHLLAGLVLLLAGLSWQISPVWADGITVTGAADTQANDGVCTLREAIVNANNNNQSGSIDCAAGGGSVDTITFAGDYVIVLKSALPLLNSPLNLDGTGRKVTVSGDNHRRIFRIRTGAVVTLTHLSLVNGRMISANGGGILVETGATLTLLNSTLADNSVLAIDGTTANGGGIFNRGTLNITNSTLSNNLAEFGKGGGIFNLGTLTLLNSTLSGNSIEDGIEPEKISPLTKGDEPSPPPPPLPRYIGGNLYNTGTVHLHNSLLANSRKGGDCLNTGAGTIATQLNSLVEDGSCNATFMGDPKLGPLQDNGGPTWTHALLPGSPAIDAGDNGAAAGLAFDQRGPGFARIANGTVDIGAFEDQGGGQTCLPTITVINTADSGAGSLRQALDQVCDGGTVDFANSLASQTIGLAGELPVSKTVTITNPNAPGLQVSGNNTGRIFHLQPGGVVTVSSLSLISGSVPAGVGGGVMVEAGASLTLLNSRLAGNSAGDSGGGLYNEGTLHLRNSHLAGNSATNAGGGLYNAGQMVVNGSTLSGNSSDGYGGGIFNQAAASLELNNSTLSDNGADELGGGVYNAGQATLANNTLAINSSIIGGGFYNEGTLQFSNTLIAQSSGGDCATIGTIGTNLNNLVEDGSCGAALSGDPLLSPLQNLGGPTPVHALLPGSPAIDAGNTCLSTDQRGIARPQGGSCDIGAFESRGFSLTMVGGNNQTTPINTAFTNPLALTVNSAVGEPVGPGGLISFVAPASGPSLAPNVIVASTAANGAVSQIVVANSISGSYTVTVSAAGISSPLAFNLTNIDPGVCIPHITVLNVANSGAGSLRQALSQVCDGGTVDFANSLAGQTITLASELSVNKTVTITNPNALGLQLSGNFLVRIFNLQPGGVVTVSSLSLVNGRETNRGGAVLVQAGATLNFLNSSIANSAVTPISDPAGGGGGLHNQGTTTLIDSSISGNSSTYLGGGIFNSATLTLLNSNLSSNTSIYGGSIFNSGSLTVNASSFSNNSAGDLGGGIYTTNQLLLSGSTLASNSAVNFGGGILGFGTLTLHNNTLSGNSAGQAGGGLLNFNTATLLNNTLSGNTASDAGSGLYNEGTVHLSNNIIANGSGSADCTNQTGTIATNLNNLVEDGSCGAAVTGDPLLGPLQNNGGPTLTHALSSGSPALNSGNNVAAAGLAFDQRGPGFPRIQNGTVDIGSFESTTTFLPFILLD